MLSGSCQMNELVLNHIAAENNYRDHLFFIHHRQLEELDLIGIVHRSGNHRCVIRIVR